VKEVVMSSSEIVDEGADLLREEVELLMVERDALLCVVGAAAVLVANLDSTQIPHDQDTIDAAEMLSEYLNALSEETLSDALGAVQAEPDPAA
jgi:hypothetical protein